MDGIERLWDELSGCDGDTVARRTCSRFDGNAYHVPFLDCVYSIDTSRRTIISEVSRAHAGQRTLPESLILGMLAFLVSGTVKPREHVWITEKELPGGSLFFQGPHALPVKPIIDTFGDNASQFVIRGVSVGGSRSEFGDGSVEFPVLPGIPMCFALWESDEEFPATCTVMFDRSFRGLFPLDVVLALTGAVVWTLV